GSGMAMMVRVRSGGGGGGRVPWHGRGPLPPPRPIPPEAVGRGPLPAGTGAGTIPSSRTPPVGGRTLDSGDFSGWGRGPGGGGRGGCGGGGVVGRGRAGGGEGGKRAVRLRPPPAGRSWLPSRCRRERRGSTSWVRSPRLRRTGMIRP